MILSFDHSKLIFSNERKFRILRHLLFWSFWGFWFGLVRELNPLVYQKTGHFPNVIKVMLETAIFLLSQIVLVYPVLYFILPHYVFTGKYVKATFSIAGLLIITIFVNVVLHGLPWSDIIPLPSKYTPFAGVRAELKITTQAYLSAMLGSLTAAALAGGLKIYKHYYVKQMRNQQLTKENIEAQLQLLRAQVHPHFLFNTLNNIYSQTQVESPKGSKMIMGLSDMLRYILYEGQKPMVPLKQELKLITEYINLEKIRYGNKLEVYLKIPDKTGDLYIAPLLLLPFVENSFKHGASKILKNPWINLTVELNEATLTMKLMNGKLPHVVNGQKSSGIGINNVRQRLELLYKGKYDLQITEDDEVFVVDLKLELVLMAQAKGKEAFAALNEMTYV